MKIDLFTGGCCDIGGNKNPRKKYYSIEEDMGVYICNYPWDPMASIYLNFENWLSGLNNFSSWMCEILPTGYITLIDQSTE